MKDLYFERREDIEGALDKLNESWSQMRGLDNPHRVRHMLGRDGMLWADAKLLEQLTVPTASRLDWGTAMNFTAGSQPLEALQLRNRVYGMVDAVATHIEPEQTLPLLFKQDIIFPSERVVETHFGFIDYVGIAAMVKAVRQGGHLSVNNDGVEQWLSAYHQTVLYNEHVRSNT